MRRLPFVFIDAERFLLPAIDLPVQLAELVAGNQLRATLSLLRDRLYFGDEVFRQPRMIDAARNSRREDLANPAHRLIVNRADEVEVFADPQLFKRIEVVVRILSRPCAPVAYLRPCHTLKQSFMDNAWAVSNDKTVK